MRYLKHPIVIGITLLWIAFWIGQLCYARFWLQEDDLSINFDAFSSLFNALAFAGIIITILFEEESRKLENFQNNFFSLLTIHNDLVKNLVVVQLQNPLQVDTGIFTGQKSVISGIEIFRQYAQGLINIHKSSSAIEMNIHKEELCQNNFDNNHSKYASAIDQYFTSLNSVLSFIEKAEIPEEKKEVYFQIMSSQLNDDQWVVIQYRSRLFYQKKKSERLKRMLKYLGVIGIHDEHSFLFEGYEKAYPDDDPDENDV